MGNEPLVGGSDAVPGQCLLGSESSGSSSAHPKVLASQWRSQMQNAQPENVQGSRTGQWAGVLVLPAPRGGAWEPIPEALREGSGRCKGPEVGGGARERGCAGPSAVGHLSPCLPPASTSSPGSTLCPSSRGLVAVGPWGGSGPDLSSLPREPDGNWTPRVAGESMATSLEATLAPGMWRLCHIIPASGSSCVLAWGASRWGRDHGPRGALWVVLWLGTSGHCVLPYICHAPWVGGPGQRLWRRLPSLPEIPENQEVQGWAPDPR